MSGIGSGISSIFGGIGDLFAASGYAKAAGLSKKNAEYVKLSTGIQETAATRQNYQVMGATTAAAGANNLSLSGSAMDVLKSNAQQGSLQKNLIALQGEIDMQGWLEKAAMDSAQAAAKTASGIGGIIGGIFSIFSDIRLKDIIAYVGEFEPGINLYRFRYKGGTKVFTGVIAQEVLQVRPELVGSRDGYLTVDYGGLGYRMQS